MSISDDALTMLIATFLFCGMLSGFIALSKDRNWLGFAFVGILLGPLGLIVTGFAHPATPTVKVVEDPERQDNPANDHEGRRPA